MNLLAADIGGTKTLLGVFRYEGQIKQLYKAKYSSEDWDNFDLIGILKLSNLNNHSFG